MQNIITVLALVESDVLLCVCLAIIGLALLIFLHKITYQSLLNSLQSLSLSVVDLPIPLCSECPAEIQWTVCTPQESPTQCASSNRQLLGEEWQFQHKSTPSGSIQGSNQADQESRLHVQNPGQILTRPSKLFTAGRNSPPQLYSLRDRSDFP